MIDYEILDKGFRVFCEECSGRFGKSEVTVIAGGPSIQYSRLDRFMKTHEHEEDLVYQDSTEIFKEIYKKAPGIKYDDAVILCKAKMKGTL